MNLLDVLIFENKTTHRPFDQRGEGVQEMAGLLQISAGGLAEAIGEKGARGFQPLLTDGGLDD